MTPQAQAANARVNSWTPPNQKFLHSKRNYQQNERQIRKWEEIFANHVSDKGLTSKICKEFV